MYVLFYRSPLRRLPEENLIALLSEEYVQPHTRSPFPPCNMLLSAAPIALLLQNTLNLFEAHGAKEP